MATARTQLEAFLGTRPAGHAQPREPEAPLRLLVLADLGGSARPPLAQRKPLAVDIDSFDGLVARIQPGLSLDLDGQPLMCRFTSLDDFHPDQLLVRLPIFEALHRAREDLQDPSQLARVAASLGLALAGGAVPTPAAAEEAGADVQRLLGRPLSAPAPASASPQTVLQAWLRERMAPHVLPDVSREQGSLRTAVDGTLTALMRRVLQHPSFQALEAAWRGIDRLVRELELGETLQLQVLDIGRSEIEADIATHQADLSASALHRLLTARPSPDATGLGLWALETAFGPEPADVQTLAALGALAARAGAPVLAVARPALAGCPSLQALNDPATWQPTMAPELAHWTALRTSPMAPWIGLVLPRVLMRLPYGAATDPISGFAFEEMPPSRPHEAYLWGAGSLALAQLAGRAFTQDGWDLDLDAARTVDDLPSHVVTEDGQRVQQPGAEVLISEQAAAAIAERGPMPLLSWRDRPAATLLRWQSIAQPLAPLRGLGG
jgi:type VI secretion system protein ImpC